MRRYILIATVALASALGTAQAQTGERFSLAGARAAVFNLAGAVRVERGTGPNVIVEVLRGGQESDRLKVSTNNLDGWSALRVEFPDDRIVYPRLGRNHRSNFNVNDDGTFGGRIMRATRGADGYAVPNSRSEGRQRITVVSRGSGVEAYADLRVLVPEGKTVAIHLGVGTVDISNVDGDVRVDTRSGGVTARGVIGSLLIFTGSGSVKATAVQGHTLIDTGSGGVDVVDLTNGTLRVDTGSGSINASEATATDVELDTGSGSIRIKRLDSPTLSANTGSGSIRAEQVTARDIELDTGSGSIGLWLLSDINNLRLNTGSGGMSLYVPRALGAQIEVDTGSGGIDTDAPIQITQKRRSYLRGTLGDGNGRIQIDTGSGGVNIRSN